MVHARGGAQDRGLAAGAARGGRRHEAGRGGGGGRGAGGGRGRRDWGWGGRCAAAQRAVRGKARQTKRRRSGRRTNPEGVHSQACSKVHNRPAPHPGGLPAVGHLRARVQGAGRRERARGGDRGGGGAAARAARGAAAHGAGQPGGCARARASVFLCCACVSCVLCLVWGRPRAPLRGSAPARRQWRPPARARPTAPPPPNARAHHMHTTRPPPPPPRGQAASPRSAPTCGSAAARATPSRPRSCRSSTKRATPWRSCSSRCGLLHVINPPPPPRRARPRAPPPAAPAGAAPRRAGDARASGHTPPRAPPPPPPPPQVATLEVALKAGTDAVTLANLMPSRWANFIRNSPMEEVKPLGTTTRI